MKPPWEVAKAVNIIRCGDLELHLEHNTEGLIGRVSFLAQIPSRGLPGQPGLVSLPAETLERLGHLISEIRSDSSYGYEHSRGHALGRDQRMLCLVHGYFGAADKYNDYQLKCPKCALAEQAEQVAKRVGGTDDLDPAVVRKDEEVPDL